MDTPVVVVSSWKNETSFLYPLSATSFLTMVAMPSRSWTPSAASSSSSSVGDDGGVARRGETPRCFCCCCSNFILGGGDVVVILASFGIGRIFVDGEGNAGGGAKPRYQLEVVAGVVAADAAAVVPITSPPPPPLVVVEVMLG